MRINANRVIACWQKSAQEQKMCRNPGSNQGPYDLQSYALPTELLRQGYYPLQLICSLSSLTRERPEVVEDEAWIDVVYHFDEGFCMIDD